MKSYTIEFNGSGEVCEGYFDSDIDAEAWVEDILEARGYNSEGLFARDWDANGKNDDGDNCYRMLFWADALSARNDSGQNSICQLCKTE